jgi:uncharacterized protein with GYD domain
LLKFCGASHANFGFKRGTLGLSDHRNFEGLEFDEAGALALAPSRLQVFASASLLSAQRKESIMPTFIIAMNWTEQGIRNIKEAPKRAAAAKEVAKKLGVEIKQTYLTNGQFDLMSIVESASGDNIAKFCMQIGALGNVRTRTVRAWPEAEYHKMISELS